MWNGKLHRHNVWFSLKFQLVPRIVYGLCSLTASFDDLSNALRKQYYQILPLGGVVRTTTIESRTIAPGFFGIGLPHLGVEALVAMSNKLLMHYVRMSDCVQGIEPCEYKGKGHRFRRLGW